MRVPSAIKSFTTALSLLAVSLTAAQPAAAMRPEAAAVAFEAAEVTVMAMSDTAAMSLRADSVAEAARTLGPKLDADGRPPFVAKPDWHRLWVNTAALSAAFVGTLLVLECLPEDATTWNRAELQDVPLFKRWHNHVIRRGPEWDHDKVIFNYVLHPYAGAAYFMAARSNGFNFWQSMLYSTLVSNVGWEFGIEAFMERPSVQDLFITPVLGSSIGECFYLIKLHIARNDYRLWGSKVLGHVLCFLVDPVNEFTSLFMGNPYRHPGKKPAVRSSFTVQGGMPRATLTCAF